MGCVEKTRVTGDEGHSLYRPKHCGSEHSELIAAPECDGYSQALVLRSMESLLGARHFRVSLLLSPGQPALVSINNV